MDEIKSAREIAMEKIREIGEATEEERLRWKYVPEGEKLAARYLKENHNLSTELSKFDNKSAPYVRKGAVDILIRNIDLPKDEVAKKNSKQAMEGIKAIINDKVAVENVYSKMRHVFTHYLEQGEQQRKQGYESLKAEFENKVQQALQQQYGMVPGMKLDVERQPQFQEELRRLNSQLDSQYLRLLDEYKQELLAIA